MKKDKSAAPENNGDKTPATEQKTAVAAAKEPRSAGGRGFFAFGLFLFLLALALFAAAALLYLEKLPPVSAADNNAGDNTEPLTQPVDNPQNVAAPISRPAETITEVKYIIPESISNALNRLEDKVGKMENLTAQYMNIKADSSAVISMGERLDALEKRTFRLAQVSNDGALMLSAALMLRENAAGGQPVRFEAEILRQLSVSQPEIKNAVDYVYNNSSRQYPSDRNLAADYRQICRQLAAKLDNQGSWQDRLLRKINKYIHISGSMDNDPVVRDIAALQKAESYVDDGQFALALKLLDEPVNQPLLADEKLKQWYILTASKLKFNRALSKICTYAFALMKTEGLQNVVLP